MPPLEVHRDRTTLSKAPRAELLARIEQLEATQRSLVAQLETTTTAMQEGSVLLQATIRSQKAAEERGTRAKERWAKYKDMCRDLRVQVGNLTKATDMLHEDIAAKDRRIKALRQAPRREAELEREVGLLRSALQGAHGAVQEHEETILELEQELSEEKAKTDKYKRRAGWLDALLKSKNPPTPNK